MNEEQKIKKMTDSDHRFLNFGHKDSDLEEYFRQFPRRSIAT